MVLLAVLYRCSWSCWWYACCSVAVRFDFITVCIGHGGSARMAKKAIADGADHAVSKHPTSAHLSRRKSRVTLFFAKLGPGIVTGAADDDPSGIATYSQVGAQFGFAMLWTMLLTYPLMAGIQEISAWIGRVSGIGLAGNIRQHYSRTVLYSLVALL